MLFGHASFDCKCYTQMASSCVCRKVSVMHAGNHRKLRVTAQPNLTLTLEHVPQHCRRAKTLLLGPLTPSDLDAAAFVHQEHGMC